MIAGEQKPMLRFLLVLTAMSMMGLQAWQTLFNNFAAEVVGMNGQQVGMNHSVREIPGFLALLAVYVLMVVREHTLAALSIILLGAGIALTGYFPTIGGMVATTLLMSFGFHYFETTHQSLALQYFKKSHSPIVFGKLRSISALASIAGTGLIMIMSPFLSYRIMYLVIGLIIIAAGTWAITQDPTRVNAVPQKTKLLMRRRYSLFYMLTFLSGARRQIFIVFSLLMLVQVLHFTVQEITSLFLINCIMNYFFSPVVGRAIARFGERKMLIIEYSTLVVVFMTYAFTRSTVVVSCMFVLDSLLFNFVIAIRTYFQKVADPQDIAPSMAMGFTINHIAAIFIPAIGGALWMIDYRIPFILGAACSLLSLLMALRVPKLCAPTLQR